MGKQNLHEKFVDQLQHRLPEGNVQAFEDACRTPLKKSITINTEKISVEDFLAITKPRGRHLEANTFTDDPTTFYIDREDLTLALGRTFLYQSGFFYIQEVAASLSAPQLDLKDGDTVLDMAAAPGGKTSQLANNLLQHEDVGMVVANDVNGKRLGSLAHNLNIMGRYNTFLTKFNGGSFGSNLPNFFDHVLLDAPCSGEGTGFKSDYAMKYRHQAEINKICGTQLQLLISAIKTTKIGGTIVYSTCTLNPFENE
jgi:16S rRNA (cytosine1407-C5)-methyltransferase